MEHPKHEHGLLIFIVLVLPLLFQLLTTKSVAAMMYNFIYSVCMIFMRYLDKIFTYIRHIGYRCPNCKRLTGIPMFQCPTCGQLHRLVPQYDGIFNVRCDCGTLLPTTVFNGRSKLKAFCPLCRESFVHGGASQIGIQIVGPVSAGKTTFLAALWHDYKNLVRRSSEIKSLSTSPKKSFDELEQWYRNGLSNATTEMNARMYSIVHNFKDNKTPLQLSFYDIAGEAFNRLGEDVQQQQFQYCEGVILLIDPTTDSAKTHDSIANFIFEIKKLKGIAVDKFVDIPVAAVISKADLYRKEIGLLRINNEAKSRPDTDKKLIQNEICRKFLQSHDFVTVLNLIDSSFTNINFFPVSAMGHEANGSEYSSWGVLYPVLWIMEQKNKELYNMLRR